MVEEVTALPPMSYTEWLKVCPLKDFIAELKGMDLSTQDSALHLRCRDDLGCFADSFFPGDVSLPWNRMHLDFLGRPKTPWTERRDPQPRADAAPRGGAKSTLESRISLVHDIVYGLEAYIAIISTSYDLSEDLVKALFSIFREPEIAEDLHRTYGPFKVMGTSTDFTVKVPGQDKRGCRVNAFSFGGTIRGTKTASNIRPTKIVIDDGEHPDKVRSPTQREKVWSFLVKDILKAGKRYTLYRVVGTVLHQDSMLAKLLKAPAWKGVRWSAILSWPDNMPLWNECRALWADLTDEDRLETARAFYVEHRAEMDKGAEVLWPEEEPLYVLMCMLWSDGAAAFYSEKQNDPRDPERQIFDIENFKRCTFDGRWITSAEGRKIDINDCTQAVWLDPIPTKDKGYQKGDYAAVARVARWVPRGAKVGYRFVLSCTLVKGPPSKQIAILREIAGQIGRRRCLYGYENNNFQNDAVMMALKASGGGIPLKGYHSGENKHERINGLEPATLLGHVQFCDTVPQKVLGQFRDHPTADHDDGPDAIERADWMLYRRMGTALVR